MTRLLNVLPLLAVISWNAPAHAEEILWRKSYAEARKESERTGKPLLLDFGTAQCSACVRLDRTTFRDPAIVRTMNSQMIPVKIDGHQEARLTELLGVSAFPTLILASSDGKILGQHVGCADVRTISAFLAKAGPAQELKAAPLARAAAPISGVAWAPNPQFFEQFQPKLDALARKLTADLNKQ